MSDQTESSGSAGKNDRSPSFPFIPLETALERLAAFEEHFKRTPARPEKAGEAWGIDAQAYADRTLAALRAFGLVDYQGMGKSRVAVVSEEGRNYLRAQQETTKREIVRRAALRPKQIAKFWNEWGSDRPADAACLDTLMMRDSFSEKGARDFLKVYDSTISYAKLFGDDKIATEIEKAVESMDHVSAAPLRDRQPSSATPQSARLRDPAPGMRKEVVGLIEGDVILEYPSQLSPESYEELDSALKLFLTRAKRRAEIERDAVKKLAATYSTSTGGDKPDEDA